MNVLRTIRALDCLKQRREELERELEESVRWKAIARIIRAGESLAYKYQDKPPRGERFHGEQCAYATTYWRGDQDKEWFIPLRWLDETTITVEDIEREQGVYDEAIQRHKALVQRRQDEADLKKLLQKLAPVEDPPR